MIITIPLPTFNAFPLNVSGIKKTPTIFIFHTSLNHVTFVFPHIDTGSKNVCV